jgi:hypothetical protein
VSGLWHGASWTFIIWGALHGFYSVFGNLTAKFRTKAMYIIGIGKIGWLNSAVQRLTTFTLVTVAWVFFRANSLSDAFFILKKLPGVITELPQTLRMQTTTGNLGLSGGKFLLCIAVIMVMEIAHIISAKRSINTLLHKQPRYLRWAVYYLFIMSIVYFGVFEDRQFIYFQF